LRGRPLRGYSRGMRLQSFTFALMTFALAASAADTPPTPRIEQVTPRVSVIVAGFNGVITVFRSDSGPVIVDSADAASAPQVQALIRTFDPRPPAAVILTHYHDDHSGGLATLAAGAPLYAHRDCLASYRKREKGAEEALAKSGRLVPYDSDTEITLGADVVRLVHPLHAHTSGDTVVVFEKEKVIAAGDLFFNGLPPYIDVADGADTAAWADTIDSLATRYAGFKVIPGHGPLSDADGWRQFAIYLRALRQAVAEAINLGQTREQAQASVRLDQFVAIKDVGAFLTKKANVGWVYDELKRK
jgi:cyclase